MPSCTKAGEQRRWDCAEQNMDRGDTVRAFSKDFRIDRGTQAVKTTSAGKGYQFPTFQEYLLLLRRKTHLLGHSRELC